MIDNKLHLNFGTNFNPKNILECFFRLISKHHQKYIETLNVFKVRDQFQANISYIEQGFFQKSLVATKRLMEN